MSTSTARKVFLTVAALLAALALVSTLGGSMSWLLDGAHDLDTAGTASETPRPPDTVDVGQDWPYYGGDPGGHRYSRADQITTANVIRLARSGSAAPAT